MTKASGEVFVGVDVGGTFTDAVVVADGRLVTAKVPTTPQDQSEAVVDAVTQALAAATLAPGSVTRFAHGMTVGTNALLEGRGAPIAFVTTLGFADIIELRRQDRAHLYRLDRHHPPPIVPRERRIEVLERCGPEGVLVPLDEASLERAVDAVASMDVEAIAVGLLFSFRFPEHERAVADALRRRLPHLPVSVSSEVVPEIREYERFSTTCIDAHLAPVLGRYLARLGERAAAAGLPEPAIMQSNGGTIALEAASRHAAWTVLSGPAGGVIGAAAAASSAGEARVLTFDMGGTSCDVALIDGEPARTAQTTINGHPLHLPMLDIETVSAGGGSIAWVDSGGALRVGPQSAGAEPGPACYGRGGTRPTVTDANVVLGRIDVTTALAGGLQLDPRAAELAIGGIAGELGLDLEACARGVIAVANQEMARALRLVSVERGIDPRGMALVAFGGAGPLHACDVAEELGIARVVLPPAAGLLAALGLVIADERRDVARTVLRPAATGRFDDVVADLTATMAGELPGATLRWSAECRYAGQSHTLLVDWDPSRPAGELVEAFHARHRLRSGDSDPTREVEVVTVRLAGLRPGVHRRPPRVARTVPPTGPASVPLDGATAWIAPGWRARATAEGAVVMER